MGENSGIEWTDHTFNPWWGCTKVSEGCDNCYAETLDARFHAKQPGGAHWGPGVPRKTFGPDHWRAPLLWNKRAERLRIRMRVFCASMADVFDGEAPAGELERLWALIRLTPWLDWLLLTKRPARIIPSLPNDWGNGYRNVWLGTSVEHQGAAEARIGKLLAVPAVVRFLSCEPLLGPLDLTSVKTQYMGEVMELNPLRVGLSWVIAGGESGPGARPMKPEWARKLRDDCNEEHVDFFFKQWGDASRSTDDPDYTDKRHGGHTKGGRLLDGILWSEVPSVAYDLLPSAAKA